MPHARSHTPAQAVTQEPQALLIVIQSFEAHQRSQALPNRTPPNPNKSERRIDFMGDTRPHPTQPASTHSHSPAIAPTRSAEPPNQLANQNVHDSVDNSFLITGHDPTALRTGSSISHQNSFLAAPFTPKRSLVLIAFGLILGGILIPFDNTIAHAATALQDGGSLALGGDLRRTLNLLQQYGDLATSLIAALVAILLDPRIRTRILDWIVAGATTSILCWLLKIGFGRPRPRATLNPDALVGYDSATWFGASFRTYPLVRDIDPIALGTQVGHIARYSWQLGGNISSDLWSMPSSHASAAGALTAVLIRLYPKLTPLCLPLLGIVMASRVIFGAHFPSDVVVGASIGLAVGFLAMDKHWGTRLSKALRIR